MGGIVIISLFIITAVISIINRGDHSLCGKFIQLVRENKADESYNLFSGNVKTDLTSSSWKETVTRLSSAYGLDSKLKFTSATQPSGPRQTVESDYNLKTKDAAYTLACFTTTEGKEHAIDGFTGTRQ